MVPAVAGQGDSWAWRRQTAGERHVCGIETARRLEHVLCYEMRGGTVTRCGVGEAAPFDVAHEVHQILRGRRAVCGHDDRCAGPKRNRRELHAWIDRLLRGCGAAHDRCGYYEQGVTVRRRRGDGFCTDEPARSGAVIHDDRLREAVGQLQPDHARDGVGDTAWSGSDD